MFFLSFKWILSWLTFSFFSSRNFSFTLYIIWTSSLTLLFFLLKQEKCWGKKVKEPTFTCKKFWDKKYIGELWWVSLHWRKFLGVIQSFYSLVIVLIFMELDSAYAHALDNMDSKATVESCFQERKPRKPRINWLTINHPDKEYTEIRL